jgi:hypothetical protein
VTPFVSKHDRVSICSRAVTWVSLFGLLLSLTASAWFLLFSTFAPYDDEGYILISLRNFSKYGGLYHLVYTQYGPAFFLIYEAVRSALTMEWDSDSVRVLTLLNWVGTTICCGLIVLNLTRSKVLAALVMILSFIYLIPNVLEPGHPGSMLALFVSVAALIGSKWDIAEWPGAAAAVGAIGALVALIKINVGAFLLIAAVFWILLHREKSSYRRFVLYSLLVALPWVLMGRMHFAVIFDFVIIGVFAAMEVMPRTTVAPNALTALIIGTVVISITVLILIMSRGTSLSGLIYGIVLDPMKHASIRYRPVWWGPFSSTAALGVLALAIGLYLRPSSKFFRYGMILGRFLGVAALLVTSVKPFSMAPVNLSYGLSVVALCAFPLRWDNLAIRDARFRQWIAIVLVLQSLQAYPIAGSQVSWGTFLLVPLEVIAVKEAWNITASELAIPTPPVVLMRSLGVCLIAMIAGRTLVGGVQNFNNGAWLGLPGAGYMSLPIGRVLTFRTLSENVRAYADQLFTVPGSFSFNLWTGVATPTLENATLWDKMLNFSAQAEIISRLKNDHEAVIIRRPGVVFNGDLNTYIESDFEPAFGVNGYEFLVHRGRKIAPLFIANIRSDPVDPGYFLLSITLRELSSPISSIEIWQAGLPSRLIPAWVGDVFPEPAELPGRSLLARIEQGSGNLRVTSLNQDGAPSEQTRSSWPVRNTLTLLEGRFATRLPQTRDLFVVVRSTEGTVASAPIWLE